MPTEPQQPGDAIQDLHQTLPDHPQEEQVGDFEDILKLNPKDVASITVLPSGNEQSGTPRSS